MALLDKYRSQNGASLAAALLFFLVCTVVAASILVAVSSSAGKTKTSENKEQKYLALTSAVEFACNAITTTQYSGRYSFEVGASESPNFVSEGSADSAMNVQVDQQSWTITFRQLPGVYRFNIGANDPAVDGSSVESVQLPLFYSMLKNDFEYIFNQQLAQDVSVKAQAARLANDNQPGVSITFSPALLSGNKINPSSLTVDMDNLTPPEKHFVLLSFEDIGAASALADLSDSQDLKDARVMLEIELFQVGQKKYGIHIVGHLMKLDSSSNNYIIDSEYEPIEAELVASPNAVYPSVNNSSSVELASDGSAVRKEPSPLVIPSNGGTVNGTYTCGPMTWVINYIEKK